MKCESCGNELTGGAIICRVCNHNNALRGMNQPWLRQTDEAREIPARRAADARPNPSRATAPGVELPRIVPRKDIDANLIRFPAASNRQAANPQPAISPSASVENDAETGGHQPWPPWRAELKERVRQVREKRNTGDLTPPPPSEPDEAELDPNPLVESALKRIRWSGRPPAAAATTGASRQGAGAATFANPVQPEPETETRAKAEPRPQPRPEPRVVETRTLTPKVNRDAAAKPEQKSSPSPEAKILTPRAKPQTAAESKAEPRQTRRDSGSQAFERESTIPSTQIKGPDRRVETQVIEFSQAPEVLALAKAEPASLWTRTVAGACDFEVVAAAYLPVFGAYATLDTSLGRESFFIMLVLLSAITFVYQLVTLMVAGRTSGMALLNLSLLNADAKGLPVTRRQKMLRALAGTVMFLCPPLNLIVTQMNTFQRSLPDLISGTTVSKL